jgi:hypothetical protein
MGTLLLLVLPAALVASVNPTSTCVEIAVLSWSKKSGAALLGAFSLIFVVVGALLLGLGLNLPDESHSPASAIIDCCLAGLMFVVGLLAVLNRPRRAMQTITRPRTGIGIRAGFVLGLGLGITNPSSLIPYAAALKEIGVRHVGTPGTVLVTLVLLVVLLAPMITPVALAYALPKAAGRVLQPLNRVLTQKGHYIMGGMSLAFSVGLALKGIRGLGPYV